MFFESLIHSNSSSLFLKSVSRVFEILNNFFRYLLNVDIHAIGFEDWIYEFSAMFFAPVSHQGNAKVSLVNCVGWPSRELSLASFSLSLSLTLWILRVDDDIVGGNVLFIFIFFAVHIWTIQEYGLALRHGWEDILCVMRPCNFFKLWDFWSYQSRKQLQLIPYSFAKYGEAVWEQQQGTSKQILFQ